MNGLEVIDATVKCGLCGLQGMAFGYIYGRCANYPAGRSAKLWGICDAATHALNSLANALFKNGDLGRTILVNTVVIVTSNIAKIVALRHLGVLGNKMTAFIALGTSMILVGGTVAYIFSDLIDDWCRKNLPNYNK